MLFLTTKLSPVYAVVFGSLDYAMRWWLTGIAFDVPHAIGNFAAALLLAVPMTELLGKLKRGYR